MTLDDIKEVVDVIYGFSYTYKPSRRNSTDETKAVKIFIYMATKYYNYSCKKVSDYLGVESSLVRVYKKQVTDAISSATGDYEEIVTNCLDKVRLPTSITTKLVNNPTFLKELGSLVLKHLKLK